MQGVCWGVFAAVSVVQWEGVNVTEWLTLQERLQIIDILIVAALDCPVEDDLHGFGPDHQPWEAEKVPAEDY